MENSKIDFSGAGEKIEGSHKKKTYLRNHKQGEDFMNYTINSTVDIWTDISNEQILMIELSK